MKSNYKKQRNKIFNLLNSGEFLPIQLIYGGQATKRLPRYQFSAGFSLSVNEKHFSNNKESVKFLNEIIVPYVKKMH